jgi:hypothetical protein
MTAIGSIVTAVAGSPSPCPVLFLDSCVLLDIVRAPLRKKASEVRVARQLLDSARKTPRTACLLIGSPTQREWSDHIDKTQDECDGAIECCNVVAAVCAHMGLTAPPPLPPGTSGLPGLLRQLSSDLLAASDTMDHNAAAMSRAIHRVIASELPARKGGTGAKDSVIVEHALETVTRLRAIGFGQPCVFVSSNTKDFAAPGSILLNATLMPVFAAVKLLYATSLKHAEDMLLAEGWVP